jgi:Sulfotransferase family
MRATYAIHRDALKFVKIYPNAKFLWSHRDPAKALGAVCSLITADRLTWRAEGIERAMDFPRKFGGERFVGRLVR